MNRLPQNPKLTQHAISSWLRQIRSGVQRNGVVQGGDMLVTETPYGIKLKNNKQEGFFTRWRGVFEPDAEYRPGDIVEVTVESTHTGTDDTGASAVLTSTIGFYICDFFVPPHLDESLFTGADAYIVNYIAGINLRNDNVVYAPIDPYPIYSPDELTGVVIQGRYWKRIAGGSDPEAVWS
jgi:hypothetical protein